MELPDCDLCEGAPKEWAKDIVLSAVAVECAPQQTVLFAGELRTCQVCRQYFDAEDWLGLAKWLRRCSTPSRFEFANEPDLARDVQVLGEALTGPWLRI